MKTVILAFAVAMASFTSAFAASERPATKLEIEKMAVGKTLGVKKYMANGRYTFQGGNPGKYTISNGKICIAFDNGRNRCDRIVTDGKSYTLVNGEGERYPFK